MPSTMKRCVGKSKKLQERNNLVYHRNFWDFYLANQSQLDRYLDCAVSKYSHYIPAEDLKQDILISLYDCDILKEFDSSKSRLSTFITNWFHWKANHLTSTQKRRDNRQTLTSELNGMGDTQGSALSKKTLVDPRGSDENTIAKELIRDLRKSIPECQREILDFLVKEYSQRDIARKFDNSPAYICQATRYIRKSALNIMKRAKNV